MTLQSLVPLAFFLGMNTSSPTDTFFVEALVAFSWLLRHFLRLRTRFFSSSLSYYGNLS